MTTTATDDYERMYQLRAAMCAWRTDPVGGRTRMVKAIAREHGATDHEITRAYLRVSAGLYPKACNYQDIDAYAAAWRDALVRELRAYKATAYHIFSVVLGRCFDEALNGGKAAKAEWRKGRQDAPPGARAPRVAAQRRAHAAQLGAVALRRAALGH
jgi:hypothetical protein